MSKIGLPTLAPDDLLEQPAHRRRKSALRRRLMLVLRNERLQFFGLFVLFVGITVLTMHAVEGTEPDSRFKSYFDTFWYTIVTITTVGYGDMFPVHPVAQLFAMVEMFVGIGLVGIVTGSVTSFLVERNRSRALGLAQLNHLAGHTVICGWKRNMKDILLGVLDANPGLSSADLVLVSMISPSEIGDLRRDRRLRHLQFVFGNYTEPIALNQAKIEHAERVIILAEEDPNAGPDEVDSRTVMAATTVESLNSRVYTCTEIVQSHFVNYLRQARVEEVIPQDESAHALLAAASLGRGVARLVARFFPEQGGQLRVARVPEQHKGSPYAEVAAYYRAKGLLPLGLLEHSGNLDLRKREHFRRALTEAELRDGARLLREVPLIQSNQPRLNPSAETRVAPHTQMLVLLPASPAWLARGEHLGSTPAPGQDNAEAGEDTLLICGWRRNMATLLRRILVLHQHLDLRLTHITVLSQMPEAEVQDIRADAALGAVRLVPGEPTNPSDLRSAGVEEAQRILVLAPSGLRAAQREVDSRNVMVAIAITHLNPRVYKCVEIVDHRVGDHMLMENVEEPVLLNRYRQMLVAHASSGSGVSHALHALLDPTVARMRVVPFAQAPLTQTFAGHAERFAAGGQLLIGVVEHTGNLYQRKQELLQLARTQPGVRSAVTQLTRLKSLTSNLPLLNPGDGFQPGPHAKAVILTPDTRTLFHEV